MPSYPKIWFLRHGQTEWNKAYRLQGQLDSPLTNQGLAEAARQATLMTPILALSPEIFVSPLGRACQTADIALGGAPYRSDDRLMEIHAGRGEGMLRKDLFAANPELEAGNLTPLEIFAACEGAETIEVFQKRILSFMADLTVPTVVVAHGLLGQILRAEAQGIALERAGTLSNKQGCVYELVNGYEFVWEAE